MAFLTNLGVSNGGYPAIRLETATITKNGVYTAPRGVAYSQAIVNVPSSGITDVNVLPDVSSFNEGDVVHLMQDDIKQTPVQLYAFMYVDPEAEPENEEYIWLFSRKPIPESIDDLVGVTGDGIIKLADVYPDVNVIIRGTDVYLVWDESTTDTYRRDEKNDIACLFLLYYTNADGIEIFVTDDTQGDLKSRIYYFEFYSGDNFYIFKNMADDIDTASIVDETLSIQFKDGNQCSVNRDTSGDLLLGAVSHYSPGYYKVENGIWVKIGAPTVDFKVYRHTASTTPYITIDGVSGGGGLGVMVRKLEGNEWKYAIWMGYNSWCDIDGVYCGLDESWFNSTTEVGYGLQLIDPATYKGEILSFVKCSYTIINTNE